MDRRVTLKAVVVVVAAVVGLATGAAGQTVTLVNPGVDDRIVSITGVTIAGTAADGVYDLTFHHGISYNTLETLVSPSSPITWTTHSDASLVVGAISACLSSQPADLTTFPFFTGAILIPTAITATHVTHTLAFTNTVGHPYTSGYEIEVIWEAKRRE